MTMTPAQASGDDDLRLPPVLTVLWAGGAGADPTAIGEAAKLLQAAAGAAAERWPDIYRGPGRARLICRDDDPPSAGRGRGGQARRRRDRRAWRRNVGLRRGAVGPARLRRDSGFEAGAGGGIGAPRRGWRSIPASSRRCKARRAGAATRRPAPRRSPRRCSRRRAASPTGAPARLSARRPERPPPSLRICAAAEAHRRAAEPARRRDDSWTRAAAVNAAASVDRGEALDRLRPEYERADALALAYGRRWRTTLAARSFLLFAVNLISGLIGALLPASSP